MLTKKFSLRPLESSDLKISSEVLFEQRENVFTIDYIFKGDVNHLLIPEKDMFSFERKDELWRDTCLEFFIKDSHSGNYLEFNFSPQGYWNSYKFTDYRENMETFHQVRLIDLNINKDNHFFKTKAHFLLEI